MPYSRECKKQWVSRCHALGRWAPEKAEFRLLSAATKATEKARFIRLWAAKKARFVQFGAPDTADFGQCWAAEKAHFGQFWAAEKKANESETWSSICGTATCNGRSRPVRGWSVLGRVVRQSRSEKGTVSYFWW